ncbi:actin-like ATPase domain-containing protein [Gonapodya prolifera JEL478]|uniref:Actin-like ATPase domain-containing protein n=1 Tax=Gonapodya prolifera (strain JEL478) TaxID=1344416 RepID=A0A139AU83_GONPJ|nr:actin-like ATPase domain-containing protein [Gonapodya prolifera JEL478]|eukprot:KXS20278.1 actin-like ATPase domain-containing protein [Gonapodya prolifera JEL478]
METLESAVGISLGSEYCALAAPLQNGRAEIFANEDGDRMIPSCVAFTTHGVVTAGAAKQQQASNVANTITRFKDLIGLPFDHADTKYHIETTSTTISSLPADHVRQTQQPPKSQPRASNGRTTPPSGTKSKAKQTPSTGTPSSAHLPNHTPPAYEITLPNPSDPSETTVTYHTPAEVATLLLSRLRESSSGYLGKDATGCCIAVPSHWTTSRLAELEAAARNAGFEGVVLIGEHSAVLSCLEGMKNIASGEAAAQSKTQNGTAPSASSTVLSVSVGAHSTSAQLFLRTPQIISGSTTGPSTYVPLAHAHNPHLGAAFLTDILSSHIALEFTRKNRIRDVPTRSLDGPSQGRLSTPLNPREFPFGPRSLSKLRRAASRAKRALSNPGAASAAVAVESLYEGMDMNGNVSSARWEGMCDSFVREVGKVVRQCLESAGVGWDVGEVVVWGGGGRIPTLVSHIRSFFPSTTTFLPSPPSLTNDPDDLVALGCAIHLNHLRALGITPQEYMEAAGYPGVPETAEDDADVDEWRAARVLRHGFAVSTDVAAAGDIPSRDKLATILPAGTPVPATVSRTVSNAVEGQKEIKIALYEVPISADEPPRVVASLVVPELPADLPAGGVEVELTVHVDEEMAVSVVAHERHGKGGGERETGKVVRVKVPGK